MTSPSRRERLRRDQALSDMIRKRVPPRHTGRPNCSRSVFPGFG